MIQRIKKLLSTCLFASLPLCLLASSSLAADFIAPNSSGEPITIDISSLSLTDGTDATIGEFSDLPRPYRDINTRSLVVFPPPLPSSEKTIQIRSGSSIITKTISFRPSPNGTLKNSSLPDLQDARGGSTATKISDGRIVLIGGSKSLADNAVDSLEVFDPETGKSENLKVPNESKRAKLKTPRGGHTATYIGITSAPLGMIDPPVEQILVVGGFSEDGTLQNTLEIVEIGVGTTQSVSTLLSSEKAKLKKSRVFHTSSLLPDGRVLIIGGQGRISTSNLGAINSIEVFDPITKLIQAAPISLNTPRLLHTATTLQDGNILVCGGFTNEKQGEFGFGPATDTAELIESKNLTIKKVGTLINKEGLGGHSATLLTNGLVLITGGNSDFFASRTKDTIKGLSKGTVQFYNGKNETFNVVTKKTGGNLELEIPRFLHQTVLLPNGNVSVIGGLNIKAGLNSLALISTPVAKVEVLDLDLLNFTNNTLNAELKSAIETSYGRILPIATLVTPQNKTQGFLSSSDSSNFVNSAIFVGGGFTNGLGKLPTKTSELIQIESNVGIEGRKIKLNPQAIIQGSYLGELLVELGEFSKVPSLKTEPQSVNLSSSNDYMATIKILSTNNEIILLKAKTSDPNTSIIISPSLFQVGESISISRKDSSALGEFEVTFVPADTTKDFIEANLRVNVSDSAKPALASVPPHGISLSTQEEANSEKVQLKVLTQDGVTELSTIPPSTSLTATISNVEIANLGGSGISSISGTLATQFTVVGIKPGKASLNFSINFPDILPVSIPIVVSGTPNFTNTPIDTTILDALSANNVELSGVEKLNPTSISIEDLRLAPNSSIFPLYIPVNLQSSIDSTNLTGLFTIRPIFGLDLLTAIPRTLVNKIGSAFRSQLPFSVAAIGGTVPTSKDDKPLVLVASSDGMRSLTYELDPNESLNQPLSMINKIPNVRDIEFLEVGNESKIPKIIALKENMLLLIDASSGDLEASTILSQAGFELELTKVDNQAASVVSVGTEGVDLVFPASDISPRVVNFHLSGNTKHISVINKLLDKQGPFVVAYDGTSTLSIVNLLDVEAQIQTIDTEGERITKIAYGGRFKLNGIVRDILIATGERKVLLFDLNNFAPIQSKEELNIKNQIEDLVVIDGVAYLALGSSGILALSIGSLIDGADETQAEIAHFKKNKLTVIKPNGRQATISKPLNAKKLANSKPFLLSTGEGNDLTIIRVSL